MPILNVDLIQCADAVMKLRAEYLYEQGRYADISFQITNGMTIPFSKYRDGYRAVASGSPGHVVLVLDLAVDKKTGEKIMLLGQSYMPSQEFHVLKSFESISPWYYVRDEELQTPEWSFAKNSLMSFE